MPADVVFNSPTRNLYFYGLLMDAERFQRDQDHCNAQRRLLVSVDQHADITSVAVEPVA